MTSNNITSRKGEQEHLNVPMSDLAEARAALRRMYHPPAWVQGGISTADAEFLLELVLDLAPESVLELGVAAGTSSAALLFALDRFQPEDPEWWLPYGLVSVDVRETCYFDERHETGSAAIEMYPEPRAAWEKDFESDARRFREWWTAEEFALFDLAFIDADHRHPWALFDLLHLAPVLRPGAWVALHDIDLPRLYPEFPSHGPMWLFEAWPFEKRAAAGSSNIGAVRLPENLGELVPMALELLRRPWEAKTTAEGLAPVFAPVETAARRLSRPAGRPRGERTRP